MDVMREKFMSGFCLESQKEKETEGKWLLGSKGKVKVSKLQVWTGP